MPYALKYECTFGPISEIERTGYTSPVEPFGADSISNTFLFGPNISSHANEGDKLEILSGADAGIYTIIQISIAGTGTLIYVREPVPVSYVGTVSWRINIPDDLPVYSIDILEKNYSGEIFQVKASGIPALLQWDTDDPKASIKGSSLGLSFINEGDLPISSFLSTDDDNFKVRLKYFNKIIFEGFLVQDDFSEPLLDYTHEIKLSANDNLGLLKDVTLDKANIFSISFISATLSIAADFSSRYFLIPISVPANVGDKIRLSGTTIDGDYTINKIVIVPNGLGDIISGIYVDEPLPSTYTGTAVFSILTPANLLNKTYLSTIIKMCLSVTGLELSTNVFSNIIEVSQDQNRSFLEQTLIDPQTFLQSDTEYMNCYDILTKIMSAFKMTLFQSEGKWNIVRWDDLRYYANTVQGFVYDKDFNSTGTTGLLPAMLTGIREDIIAQTGLSQKFCRPFLFAKETFNYKYPRQLLRNFDLKQLGSFIKEYTVGSGTGLKKINEYNAPWWYASELPLSHHGNFFIRVTTDSLDNELDRVLVVNGDAKSYPIEVNANDSFKFSFSFKTQDSQPGNITLQFIVELNNGTTRMFFHNPAATLSGNMWQSGVGFSYNIIAGDNSNQWHGVEIDSSYYPIPYDGLLYCYVRVADLGGTINETYYKDIRFEYTARINESTKIIGQTHQTSQPGIIKNNDDIEIFIDNSPRNSIAGTLFLDQKIGLLQKRTERWRHSNNIGPSKRLGELVTFDQLFWRMKPRTILEGTLYGLIHNGVHISLLSVIKYSYFNDLNFVFGRLEIDFRNNKFDCTLWEMWQDDERDSDLGSSYQFNYLYSTQ